VIAAERRTDLDRSMVSALEELPPMWLVAIPTPGGLVVNGVRGCERPASGEPLPDLGPEGPGQSGVLGALTVREICDFDLLRDAAVLAGDSGLERRVQRLNVMTVPDIARWTKPHELLLATGFPLFPLARSTDGMTSLLRELDERGLAGLAVKLGDYGTELGTETLRVADELGMPIIAVPEEVAFDDILSQVLAALTNRQAAALGRAQEVHNALLRISLVGGGLNEIVQELKQVLTETGIVCIGINGEILAARMDDSHWEHLRSAGVLSTTGSWNRLASLAAEHDQNRPAITAAAISAGQLRHGYILGISTGEPADPEVKMMIQQAAMVAALDISRDMAVSEVTRRFEASAIHGLLTGSEREITEVADRSGDFEWNLQRPLVVLVGRRTSDSQGTDAPPDHDSGSWLSAVRAVDREAAAGLLGRNHVAICGAGDGPTRAAELVRDRLVSTSRAAFQIGTSETVTDLASLPTAYQHARMALEFTQRSGPSESVTSYESLGLYRLLNRVPEDDLEAFAEETLGPVLRLERQQREDLLHTLEVLCASRMNVAESARVLHYHYNTLRYRIRRLEKVLGPFTEDAQLELRIAVALQIMAMRAMKGWPRRSATAPYR
jgi:PucR family transcriptional regulator, purine catabolism regulatory protein